jgi:hypothetical protein
METESAVKLSTVLLLYSEERRVDPGFAMCVSRIERTK